MDLGKVGAAGEVMKHRANFEAGDVLLSTELCARWFDGLLGCLEGAGQFQKACLDLFITGADLRLNGVE